MATALDDRPQTRASLRYGRFSATKARQVLDLVRGKPVAEARAILELTERACSVPILKVLDSAIANAEHNDSIAGEELFVAACWADEGPTLRRFRPRARGRATRIRKRTCHVTIVLARFTPTELAALRARTAGRGAAPADARAQRARRVARSRSREAVAPEAEETVTEATGAEQTSEDTSVEAAEATTEAAEATTEAAEASTEAADAEIDETAAEDTPAGAAEDTADAGEEPADAGDDGETSGEKDA